MSNIDYILNLCHDIKHSGRTPSVALIKNEAHRPIALPEIIKGLQHWKTNPNQARKSLVDAKVEKQPSSLEQRVELLEQQLANVLEQVNRLQKHINTSSH
ncbi:hypothetical protein RS130_21325 [Paraglaciecola aquimarina]|uniref:KfrA N-terminal DNA-binding domain-containing protein n=1 Tax=Paraglaciecola aquimarina TaxID=1235557 RepID=A0ABU3T1E3_9ALTE|nr:hypothetical protein [Paraglaciecola aquimarina]MDU0356092.1 hypothetical protein [Paraglaciecola aquimarina]